MAASHEDNEGRDSGQDQINKEQPVVIYQMLYAL
jgi:hypothetical protein